MSGTEDRVVVRVVWFKCFLAIDMVGAFDGVFGLW